MKNNTHIARKSYIYLIGSLLLSCVLAVPMLFAETEFAETETQQVDIIVLQNRPAQTLIATIRPLLPPDAAISASGNQLIVRSTPEHINSLHLLIEELDTPLTSFMLSISFATDTGSRLDNHAFVKRYSTRKNNHMYQVQALEGYPSQIQTSTTLPTTIDPTMIYPDYIVLDQDNRTLVSNFSATPRLLKGGRIMIDINTQHSHNTTHSQSHNTNQQQVTQAYSGAITGKLGEWLAIGSTSANHRRDSTASTTRHHSTTATKRLIIYLKAERLE